MNIQKPIWGRVKTLVPLLAPNGCSLYGWRPNRITPGGKPAAGAWEIALMKAMRQSKAERLGLTSLTLIRILGGLYIYSMGISGS